MVNERVRVLAIDGGGIRGLIPALLLAEIERRAGVRSSEVFDLIVGTSTGGIIGIGAAIGRPAEELAQFYPSYGRRIFGGDDRRSAFEKRIFGPEDGFWKNLDHAARQMGGPFGGNPSFGGNARHTTDGLEHALREVLGDLHLSAAATELTVTSFDGLTGLPVLFSTRDARADAEYDVLLRDVARATSAAPTYFPPLTMFWGGQTREFVDGGVWANNPSAVALTESLAMTSEREQSSTSILLVSLGTGVAPGGSLFDGNQSWLGVAQDMTGLATSVWSGEVLARRALGVNYKRLQVLDPRIAGAMDDPSEARLTALTDAAAHLIAAESATLDQLITELVA
jgi:patatin-like phospholipase/acyl hydrolase